MPVKGKAVFKIWKRGYNCLMTLGDLNKKVNLAGGKAYNDSKERIMREAKEIETRRQAQEADRLGKEISHLRLHKQTLEGRMVQLKNEIAREKDTKMRSFKETELHKLMNDKMHLEGEILSKQGRERAAHNVRYNNPHYF
jgi:hypothetical protein